MSADPEYNAGPPDAADSEDMGEAIDDVAATFDRIEQRLAEIRVLLDQGQRVRQHQEFSAARLVGAVIQALVIGLLAWALTDWAFQAPADSVLIKLGFAAVLQLMALSAFVLMPKDR